MILLECSSQSVRLLAFDSDSISFPFGVVFLGTYPEDCQMTLAQDKAMECCCCSRAISVTGEVAHHDIKLYSSHVSKGELRMEEIWV